MNPTTFRVLTQSQILEDPYSIYLTIYLSIEAPTQNQAN